MKQFSVEFDKRSGGKLRKFNNPNSELRTLIDEVSTELIRLFPEMKSPCRVQQSIEDIQCYEIYSHVKLLDIKKALMSGNAILICFTLGLLYPRSIPLLPKILRIYSAPVFGDDGQEVSGRSYRLKAGFRTSEQLLNILFMKPLKIFNRTGSSRLYVDDVILFSNHKIWLNFYFHFLKMYFYFLGFQFHKIESYDLRSRPKRCGQRLGLYFGFNDLGELLTKIRPRTLRKYQSRIKRSIQNVQATTGLERVGNLIYGPINPPAYPIYATFNKYIWTDSIQRKQFFARCCGVLKSRYPELRKYSKEELSLLLWGHSYKKTPVLEEDLWTGTIGSSSALNFADITKGKFKHANRN